MSLKLTSLRQNNACSLKFLLLRKHNLPAIGYLFLSGPGSQRAGSVSPVSETGSCCPMWCITCPRPTGKPGLSPRQPATCSLARTLPHVACQAQQARPWRGTSGIGSAPTGTEEGCRPGGTPPLQPQGRRTPCTTLPPSRRDLREEGRMTAAAPEVPGVSCRLLRREATF